MAVSHEARSAQAARLRHAQVILPRGVHRTRVSETRKAGVRAARPHPFRTLERIPAARSGPPPGSA